VDGAAFDAHAAAPVTEGKRTMAKPRQSSRLASGSWSVRHRGRFLKGHFSALKDTSVLSHDSIAELCLSRLGDLVAFEVSPGLCLVRLATPTCQRGRREG